MHFEIFSPASLVNTRQGDTIKELQTKKRNKNKAAMQIGRDTEITEYRVSNGDIKREDQSGETRKECLRRK